MTGTEPSIPQLLELARVRPSHAAAAARWLADAIAGARSSFAAAQQRPLNADHNDLLASVTKEAKALSQAIKRLRSHPSTWRAFWRSSAFGAVYLDRVEIKEVLLTIEHIAQAAKEARVTGTGRRREAGKQHVIDSAFAFFVRFSPRDPSGTPTGAFAKFARAFYSAAITDDTDEAPKLDRQIREALKRLPIERERARQKSVKKSRVSS